MASSFKHDAQGFLVGEVVESTRDLVRLQQQGISIWKSIRTDVRAIGRAVGAQVSASMRNYSAPASPPRSVSPRNRVSATVNTSAGRSAGPSRVARGPSGRTATPVVTQARAANGRFVAGGQRGGAGSNTPAGPQERNGPGWAQGLGRLGDSMARLSRSLEAVDNVDPTVAAVKEVKDVVSPLGRGLGGLFGRTAEQKKARWRDRILKLLTGKKADEKKQTGGGTGGGGGFLGNLLGSAGGSGVGGLLGALAGGGKGLLKNGLRRLPLLGALFAGGSALFSAFGGDDDPNASPEQNRAKRFHNTGQAAGMGIGGAIGAVVGSFLGPAGTLAGGYLGAVIGEKVGGAMGDWTKSLIDSGVPERIVAFVSAAWTSLMTDLAAAWDGVTTVAKSAWTSFTTDLSTAWEGITKIAKDVMSTVSSVADAANNWVKEKTGFDVKGAISTAIDKATELRDRARGAVADGAKWLGDRAVEQLVPETMKRAYGAGAAAATQAKAGYDVARGNGTAAPDPSGKLQSGARAVGAGVGEGVNAVTGGKSAQRALATGRDYAAGNIGGLDDAHTRALVASTAMTESAGGKLDIVNSAGYMGRYQAGAGWLADAGLINGGSAAVKAAMKRDGYTSEYKWGQSGGMTKFLKDEKNWSGGMSYDKYLASAQAQDAAFKTNSDAAYNQLLKSGTIDSNTSQDRVAGLLKARHIAGMGGAMAVARGGTGAVDANGTSARKYYDDVASNRNGFLSAYKATPVTSASLPTAPPTSVPSAASVKVPPAPELPTAAIPLNSEGAGAGRGTINVSLPETIGQDIGDRGIAHIVTGGIGR